MSLRTRALILWTVLFLLAMASPAGARSMRMALIVGNDCGLGDEPRLRYAESEALEVYKLLIELGRVQPARASLALGEDADSLRRRLDELRQQVADVGAEGEVLLLFYYSGHASEDALHLDGTRLPLSELKEGLLAAGARTLIAFVDACHGGGLIRAKGLELGPAFEMRLEPAAAAGRVFISSSGPGEASLEAEEIRGSFFSHYLISGMRGDADSDADGAVDLAEIYRYTYDHTLARTAETRAGAQHPAYDYDLHGAGSIVLAWPGQAEALLVLGPGSGCYLVLTKYARRVLAEVCLADGETRRLAVPARSVLVKKRVRTGYRVGEVNLSWGGEKRLDEAGMELVAFREAGEKGLPEIERHALQAGFAVRGGVVDGNSHLLGATLAYRYDLDESLRLGAALDYLSGQTSTLDGEVPTHGFAISAELSYRLDWGPFSADLGSFVSALFVWQEIPGWPDRNGAGFAAGARAEVTWAVFEPLWLVLGLRAGLQGVHKGSGLEMGLLLGADAGAAFRF
ncbi:MAG: caspase family protein [Deltaproteobacteria bacterium]|nr:caspase family protein [Deltaproteobacteria bacterium]